MEQPDRSERRDMWQDVDSGWTISAELLTATFVWGGIGWLLDRWLDTAPVLLVLGFVLGFGLGMYLAFVRAKQQGEAEEAKRPRL